MSFAIKQIDVAEAAAEDGISKKYQLSVTRIARGQAINKVFAERIVCKAIVKGLQDLDEQHAKITSVLGLHSELLPK
jgi:hypothetical protein